MLLPTAAVRRISPTSLVLGVVCLAQFMVVLDVSIVNVALPDIRSSLHLSENGLGWVLNAYTLTFAGFLLLGGRAADIWGRRRLFLIGLALFTVFSLLGGLAQNGSELIAARAAQGLGGAILSPATLTILTTTFTEPKARTRALGLWSAVAGAGGATGVLLGGVLTQALGWRWILFINVPIGLAVMAVARLVIAESRAQDERKALDWAGALTITGGLTALVYGVVSTDAHSWGSPTVLGPLAVGLALLALFGWVESHHHQPLVPLRLFRSRSVTGANLIMVMLGSAMFGIFFFLSQFLQDVQHYSPLRTGFAFLPMPLAIIAGTQLSSRVVGRVGVRTMLLIGPALAALGVFALSRLGAGSGYLLGVGLPGALTTFGVGISFVPITLAATGGVDRRDAGLASGLINTTRQIGGSLGLAALLTVSTSRMHALAGRGFAVSTTAGYDRAFEVAAGLLLVAAIIAAVVLPRQIRAVRAPLEQAADEGLPVLESA